MNNPDKIMQTPPSPAKPQHTPGPWTVERASAIVAFAEDGYKLQIASAWSPNDSGLSYAEQHVQQRINARLIAAAPTLLETLQSTSHDIADAMLALREGDASMAMLCLQKHQAQRKQLNETLNPI